MTEPSFHVISRTDGRYVVECDTGVEITYGAGSTARAAAEDALSNLGRAEYEPTPIEDAIPW